MTDVASNQLTAELARDMVAQIAPQELPLFRAISTAYFKNPGKPIDEQIGKDEMLGFGLGEAVAFLTPVILAVTTEVVMFLTVEVSKSVKEESASLVSDIVKAMFTKFRPSKKEEVKPEPLTRSQLAHVRKLVIEKASLPAFKLPESQAQLLADALVGTLSVGDS